MGLDLRQPTIHDHFASRHVAAVIRGKEYRDASRFIGVANSIASGVTST